MPSLFTHQLSAACLAAALHPPLLFLPVDLALSLHMSLFAVVPTDPPSILSLTPEIKPFDFFFFFFPPIGAMHFGGMYEIMKKRGEGGSCISTRIDGSCQVFLA